MPAADHLHPAQMRLFMQAHELMDLEAGDSHSPFTKPGSMKDNPDLAERKVSEAKEFSKQGGWVYKKEGESSLVDDIKEHGVKNPVLLKFPNDDPTTKPTIFDGHHRIAAAHHVNPDSWIPVEYGSPSSIKSSPWDTGSRTGV